MSSRKPRSTSERAPPNPKKSLDARFQERVRGRSRWCILGSWRLAPRRYMASLGRHHTARCLPFSPLIAHGLANRLHAGRLVLDTLDPLPGDRKCFRMINGVLVERTVQDVVPALRTNAEGLKKVLDDLVKQYKTKQDELEKWKVWRPRSRGRESKRNPLCFPSPVTRAVLPPCLTLLCRRRTTSRSCSHEKNCSIPEKPGQASMSNNKATPSLSPRCQVIKTPEVCGQPVQMRWRAGGREGGREGGTKRQLFFFPRHQPALPASQTQGLRWRRARPRRETVGHGKGTRGSDRTGQQK